MSYKHTQIEDLLMLRWEQVTTDDVGRVHDWVRAAYAGNGERPVGYIAVIPTDSPPPDTAARRALMSGHQATAEFCTTLRLVILGTGMRQALIRSISAGFMLASGLRGQAFDIDARFEAAAAAAARSCRPDTERIISGALDAGIVTKDELEATIGG